MTKLPLLSLQSPLLTRRTIIFTFLLTNIGLYYENTIYFVLVGQLALLLCVGFQLLKNSQLPGARFSLHAGLFFLLALASILWAGDPSHTGQSVLLLGKCILFAVALRIVIHDSPDLDAAVHGLMLGGLVYAILYLSNVTVAELAYSRLAVEDSELPNINVVASAAMFPAVFYFFRSVHLRSRFSLIVFIVSFVILLILGSRRALALAILGIIFIGATGAKRGIHIVLLVVVSVAVAVIMLIPIDYLQFIVDRATSTFSSSEWDESDRTRVGLFSTGIVFFEEAPIWGAGYYSFSQLYQHNHGEAIYAHNNYIETLVGLGLVGFAFYYYLYYWLMRRAVLILRRKSSRDNLKIVLIFAILLFLLMIGQLFISVSNDRFTWIFLGIASAAISINDRVRNNGSLKEHA